ncbi:MAG: hypothetical protein LUH03_09865 [Oscillospiraceae bacterium]|nr:hypothetical protein [Oscillospiraceae bacterium]
MTLEKWDYKDHRYHPHKIPDNWKVAIIANDMNEIINCANCGTVMTYGASYVSHEIHTAYGMGFCVCAKCYSEEVARKLESECAE